MKHKQKRSQSTGQIRIIGGDCRGRKLPVLDAEGLRPTSDRVKETLFNWVQFDVPGARCLDVFSGAGSLGFEAASRGAKLVTMLELNSANAKQLKLNAQTLKLQNIDVQNTDSLLWLANANKDIPYDVIWLDPPFHQGLMQQTLELLFANNWAAEKSLIYIEQEKKLAWPEFPEGWSISKEKTTSQVRFALFEHD